MQSISQDIKNNSYRRIYLLYGPESYLRLQYRDKLKNALAPGDDSMNYTYHEGKGVNIGEIIDTAETMPFFADYRTIILENSDLNKEDSEKLAEYIPSIPESTVVILVEEEADKRTKLYKAIAKSGRCIEFPVQDMDTLKKWIVSKIAKENKKITGNTLDLFLDTVGTDMSNIVTELEKLFSYTMGRDVITDEDIKTICTVTLNSQVFDMINLMSQKRTKEALNMYHELLSQKQSPFGILALVSRQFNVMLQISEMQADGLSMPTIESRMGMTKWIVNKYLPQLKNYKRSEMRRILKRCVESDEAIKMGNLPAETAIELLIIEASGV